MAKGCQNSDWWWMSHLWFQKLRCTFLSLNTSPVRKQTELTAFSIPTRPERCTVRQWEERIIARAIEIMHSTMDKTSQPGPWLWTSLLLLVNNKNVAHLNEIKKVQLIKIGGGLGLPRLLEGTEYEWPACVISKAHKQKQKKCISLKDITGLVDLVHPYVFVAAGNAFICEHSVFILYFRERSNWTTSYHTRHKSDARAISQVWKDGGTQSRATHSSCSISGEAEYLYDILEKCFRTFKFYLQLGAAYPIHQRWVNRFMIFYPIAAGKIIALIPYSYKFFLGKKISGAKYVSRRETNCLPIVDQKELQLKKGSARATASMHDLGGRWWLSCNEKSGLYNGKRSSCTDVYILARKQAWTAWLFGYPRSNTGQSSEFIVTDQTSLTTARKFIRAALTTEQVDPKIGRTHSPYYSTITTKPVVIHLEDQFYNQL